MAGEPTVGAGWSTPVQVLDRLRHRWSSGELLRAVAGGAAWQPMALPLRGPGPADLGAHFGAAQDWVRLWENAPQRWRLEYAAVGGRTVGVNRLPRRVWIDAPDLVWQLLQVGPEVRRFEALLATARRTVPALVDWIAAHPLRVLALGRDWDLLVATVRWIDARPTGGLYLRQVDVPGVDTKFLERHRAVLADLLDRQLPAERRDPLVPRTSFAKHYGFRDKPQYVRFRVLAEQAAPYSELTVRADELAASPPPGATVYVVENEITFLALPAVDDAIAIFGGGYAVSTLQALPWLRERELRYWGDLDTHGFAMLNQVRSSHPHARSLLMDRATLLAHEGQWGHEPRPTRAHLQHLTAEETQLYRDLVEDSFGPSLRLEQERIGYAFVERALGC